MAEQDPSCSILHFWLWLAGIVGIIGTLWISPVGHTAKRAFQVLNMWTASMYAFLVVLGVYVPDALKYSWVWIFVLVSFLHSIAWYSYGPPAAAFLALLGGHTIGLAMAPTEIAGVVLAVIFTSLFWIMFTRHQVALFVFTTLVCSATNVYFVVLWISYLAHHLPNPCQGRTANGINAYIYPQVNELYAVVFAIAAIRTFLIMHWVAASDNLATEMATATQVTNKKNKRQRRHKQRHVELIQIHEDAKEDGQQQEEEEEEGVDKNTDHTRHLNQLSLVIADETEDL